MYIAKKINKFQIMSLLIALFFVGSVQNAEAYTRLTAGSVWDESSLLQDVGSSNYSCVAGLSCQNNTSASVISANSTKTNKYLEYKCVNGNVCQDTIHTELKYVKSIIGPGSRLGAALIPSITSVRTFNSQGEDVTYDSCVQPGEEIEIIISSEHRTCGTRYTLTHYEVAFNEQTSHITSPEWWQGTLNTFTGGFTFKAPLIEGSYSADIAVINPYNLKYWNRGFDDFTARMSANGVNGEGIRSGYYTYEIGKHTVNVCKTDDGILRASCFASPIQVLPNAEVTFTGKAAGGVGPYTYRWEDGTKGDIKTVSYETTGSKPQRIIVEDSVGNSAESTCAVSVTNNLGEDITKRNGGESNWNWSFGDGFIPLGEILSFGADRLVTNNTCAFEWETEGMMSCRILSADGSFEEVETTGTKDLPGGGTYTLECFDAYSADSVKSQPVRCLANPTIREI